MKTYALRFLSVVLAVCLLAGCLPMAAVAEKETSGPLIHP